MTNNSNSLDDSNLFSSFIESEMTPSDHAPSLLENDFQDFVTKIQDLSVLEADLKLIARQNPRFLSLSDSKTGFTPLMIAIVNRRIELAMEWVENSNVNHQNDVGWSPLLLAVPYDQLCAKLLEFDANPALTTNQGLSYLTSLSTYGKIDQIKKLLLNPKYQIVLLPDVKGWPPLFAAITSGNFELVKFFHTQGASLNQFTSPKNQWSAIHQAILSQKLEIAQYLHQHKAPFNTEDHNGNNILHIAAKTNNLPICQWALSLDLDPQKENRYGDLPFDYATEEVIKNLFLLSPDQKRIPHLNRFTLKKKSNSENSDTNVDDYEVSEPLIKKRISKRY